MNSSPCAKLTMPRMPKISASPTPISTYIAPRTRPWKTSSERMAGSRRRLRSMRSEPLLHDVVEPLAEGLDRPLVAVLAQVKHIHPVRDADRLPDVLVDDQDGVAVLLEAGDLRVDLVDQLRHQADRGLVEQQGLGARHGEPRHLEQPLLAAREGACRPAPALLELRVAGVDALEPLRHPRLVPPDRPGPELEVLLDRHRREGAAPLEQ